MTWADKRPTLAAVKLPAREHYSQTEVRDDVLAGRRGLFKPPPEGPGRTDDVLDERIAEELSLVIRQLAQMRDVLTGDPILRSRHVAQLRSIDLMEQELQNWCRVVSAADKAMAIDRITMSDLKARLKRSALRAIVD
jgi:hypothetical protein